MKWDLSLTNEYKYVCMYVRTYTGSNTIDTNPYTDYYLMICNVNNTVLRALENGE